MRTLGRTAGGHEPDVPGPTAEVSRHETYRREWIGRRGKHSRSFRCRPWPATPAMRAVLLAGANTAPSEGDHTERGDYFHTGASFAVLISVRANHWPRSVNRAELCRRFLTTKNMPSRARSATVTPEMCLPSGVPHQQPLRL